MKVIKIYDSTVSDFGFLKKLFKGKKKYTYGVAIYKMQMI